MLDKAQVYLWILLVKLSTFFVLETKGLSTNVLPNKHLTAKDLHSTTSLSNIPGLENRLLISILNLINTYRANMLHSSNRLALGLQELGTKPHILKLQAWHNRSLNSLLLYTFDPRKQFSIPFKLSICSCNFYNKLLRFSGTDQKDGLGLEFEIPHRLGMEQMLFYKELDTSSIRHILKP